MGLLDLLNTREGIIGLTLLDAGSAKPVRTSTGGGLLQAIGQGDAWEQTQKQRKLAEEDRAQRQMMQALQMEQMRAQLGESSAAAAQRQRQLEQAQRDESLIRQNFAPLQGPTPDGSPIQPNRLDPRFMLGQGASLQGLQQAMQLDSALNPQAKPDDFKVVGGSLVRIKPDSSVAEAYRAPEKPDKPPSAVQEYEYAKGQGFKGSFADWELQKRRAGATSVSVNTDNLGLKPKDRFEMEQKLAGDYTAATKLDRGIISTAQDITNILKQGGALKDQAAIYKFAKALDPDGAVREADYAAIVQTAGGLGYVQALFNKALTGEQLLPRQRQEMISISQAMANVAQKRIENQRSSLSRNARQYNLTPENIFAPTETMVQPEPTGATDLQSAAAAELARRRRGGN